MTLRIGTLCFCTDQGLGVLARSFHRAGLVTDVLLVRHGSRVNHADWYPGATMIDGRDWLREQHVVIDFLRDLDVLLFFETPFYWQIFDLCRASRIKTKTALMPMYECMPDPLPTKPDLFLCPSLLDLEYCPGGVLLPVPVEVPWRQRARAEAFVHNAGNGGLLNRNGTGVLLDAMRYVRSPVKLIVRSQKPLQWGVDDPRVEVRIGTVPYEQLWDEGDCLIHPHHFDGLSLPLQEARAAGMLVMGVDRCPDNVWLPREPLIPVSGYTRRRVSPRCNEFDYAILDPRDVAAKIDQVYGMDLGDYSRTGQEWAASMSWAALRPRYLEVLEGLCNGK